MKTTGLTMVEAMLAYAADYEIESESCEGGHRRKNWDGEDVLFCVGETWSIVPRTFTFQEATKRVGHRFRKVGDTWLRMVTGPSDCWATFIREGDGHVYARVNPNWVGPDARYEEVSDE